MAHPNLLAKVSSAKIAKEMRRQEPRSMVTIQGGFPSLSRLLQIGHLVHNDLE